MAGPRVLARVWIAYIQIYKKWKWPLPFAFNSFPIEISRDAYDVDWFQ